MAYKHGVYNTEQATCLTVPIHGHPHATRRFDVVPGVVMIKRWPFTQEDFFRVNRLA